jgi:hypothetical protein
MGYDIEIGNFLAEKQQNGTFLYKAKEDIVSSTSKVSNPQYKERPQYPLIEQYESKATERFQQDLKTTVIEVVEFLNQIK